MIGVEVIVTGQNGKLMTYNHPLPALSTPSTTLSNTQTDCSVERMKRLNLFCSVVSFLWYICFLLLMLKMKYGEFNLGMYCMYFSKPQQVTPMLFFLKFVLTLETSLTTLIIAVETRVLHRQSEELPPAQNNCLSHQQEEAAVWLWAKYFNWPSARISAVAK